LALMAICCEVLERLNSFSNSAFSDSLKMIGTAASCGIDLNPQICTFQ
jgi:hypothetical protein